MNFAEYNHSYGNKMSIKYIYKNNVLFMTETNDETGPIGYSESEEVPLFDPHVTRRQEPPPGEARAGGPH